MVTTYTDSGNILIIIKLQTLHKANVMEKNQANEIWSTWGTSVPVQYKGAINLQAALLLLFKWDEEKQVLLHERTTTSFNSAAKVLGTTTYKLKKLIECFEQFGMEGVRAMNLPRSRRCLNITAD